MSAGSDVERLLDLYAPPVPAIARVMREVVRARLPGVDEQPDPSAKVIGYGYGPGYKGLICTLILSKKGVKLGFYRGSELPDPHGLLEGSGKVHRYVVVDSIEAAGRPELAQLLESAVAAFKTR